MDKTRFSGIFDVSNTSVCLIGCGGIGAITAVTLAKMGVRYLHLIDNDTVDEVNIATQLHAVHTVGLHKVDAVRAITLAFSDEVEVMGEFGTADATTELFGAVIISAVDSITARKNIWEAVKRSSALFYIDARMAAREYQQYTVDLQKPTDWYEKMLVPQSEENVSEEPCTAKATFFCAALAAAHLGNAVQRIAMARPTPKILVQNLIGDAVTVIP